MKHLQQLRWLAVMLLSGAVFSAHAAIQVPGPLVDPDWLEVNQDNVVMLDVRKDTKSFTERPKRIKKSPINLNTCGATKGKGGEVAGHIDGAVLVPWKPVRAERMVDGQKVIKLVPEKAAFEKMMRESGVNNDSAVVIVTKGESSKDLTFGTRLYWTLKYYGHDNVAMLDGGMKRWLMDGRKATKRATDPKQGNFTAGEERREMLALDVDVEQAVQNRKVQLLDGRDPDYYLGLKQKDYVYAKGHITSARNVPHPTLFDDSGDGLKFRDAKSLKVVMSAANVDPGQPTITYCDSGHLSTGHWFVLHELLGNKQARLYDGSMHQWTKNKSHPVNTP